MAHQPGRTHTSRIGERDALLARRLMTVAQLVAETRDLEVVGAAIVGQCMGRRSGSSGSDPRHRTRSALAQRVRARSDLARRPATGHRRRPGCPRHRRGHGGGRRHRRSGTSVATVGSHRVDAPGHPGHRPTPLPGRGAAGRWSLHLVSEHPLDAADLQVVRVFAGLAVVMVVHSSDLARSAKRVEQLEDALQNRVLIEQAKGFLLCSDFDSAAIAYEAMRASLRPSAEHAGPRGRPGGAVRLSGLRTARAG